MGGFRCCSALLLLDVSKFSCTSFVFLLAPNAFGVSLSSPEDEQIADFAALAFSFATLGSWMKMDHF